MHIRILRTAATAALLLASSVAMAKDITFTVDNRTGSTMTGLYGGPSSEGEWGENILAQRIPPGGELEVTVGRGQGCKWDFLYEFADKASYEEYEVDICAIDGDSFVIQ